MREQELAKDTLLFGNLGSYVIEEVIGRGGFGVTYRASSTGVDLPSYVAIKEFFPRNMCSRTLDPDSFDLVIDSPDKFEMITQLRDRFIKESRNVEACNHPGIVRVFETIECNGTAYMVMELIEGQSVKQIVDQYKDAGMTMPPEMAENIIRQLASSLHYLHNKHMTHLDVKPDNLMLAGNRVVLIDFGLSKQFNDDGSSDSQVLTALSKGYAPPEQYIGITSFSPESDVYSLGATFYKLLTGSTPPEPYALQEKPNSLVFEPSLPYNYKLAVHAAMELNRKKRIDSAYTFVEIIEKGAKALGNAQKRFADVTKDSGKPVVQDEPYHKTIRAEDIVPDIPSVPVKIKYRKPNRGIKWFFNFLLIAIIALSVFEFSEQIEHGRNHYYRLFHQDKIELLLSYIGVIFVSITGLLARSLIVKILFAFVSCSAVILMLINCS